MAASQALILLTPCKLTYVSPIKNDKGPGRMSESCGIIVFIFSVTIQLFHRRLQLPHLIHTQRHALPHFTMIRTPFPDIIFGCGSIPGHQVQLFCPAFSGCGQGGEVGGDFVFYFCGHNIVVPFCYFSSGWRMFISSTALHLFPCEIRTVISPRGTIPPCSLP